ncbi:MAG: site-specific integrase, partial [Muribaculaceae bacterium]|nr:site-specific integrase [Muribaculaceae bacterium]
ITPVIVPAKALVDGSHKIRIAVAHNGTTRYLVTPIKIDNDRQFKNGTIVKRPDAAFLNTKLRKELQKVQAALDELDYIDGLSCSEVISLIKKQPQLGCSTFGAVCDEWMGRSGVSANTIQINRDTFKYIYKHIPRSTPLKSITPFLIQKFISVMEKERYATNTRLLRIQHLRSIINYSIKRKYVEYKTSPFVDVNPPCMTVRQSWLTVEEFKIVREAHLKWSDEFARDIFLLSFYLGGINYHDIVNLPFAEIIRTGNVKYQRSKIASRTAQYVEFAVPKEALEIIRRYFDGNKLRFKSNMRSDNIYNTNAISSRMARMATRLNMPHLVFYSARKTFAQIALEIGIPTVVIDYLLGHSMKRSGSVLHHYLHVTPQMATEALRKVCDFVK